MGLLQYLLSNTEFKSLLKFVSPSFFQVASPKQILEVATQLTKNYSDAEAWAQVLSEAEVEFKRLNCAITLQKKPPNVNAKYPPLAPLLSNPKLKEWGHQILGLYFRQVLNRDRWILDFRSSAFGVANGLVWSPQPAYYSMDPQFRNGVAELYRGFYLDDSAQFDRAVKTLGIEAASTSLRKHFGSGDQSAVQFKLLEFQKSFGDVFTDCRDARVSLKSDFFVLGISLLGLYECLESTGLEFDVRNCFREANS